MAKRKKNVAVIVAGGKGTRVGSREPKQFLPIGGRPMLYYTLKAFSDCSIIDEIIVVVGAGDVKRTRDQVIDAYYLKKIAAVVPGGKERYDSVYAGINAIEGDCGYVFIHDGARPCIEQEVIARAYSGAKAYDACIVGIPEVDTVRRVLKNSDVAGSILNRDEIWHVQTPQVFEYRLLKTAYDKFMERKTTEATDDAIIVEKMTRHEIHIQEGSPMNIKVTTRADLTIAESYLASLTGRKRK